jgi:apolipoprotein N-acyltransferase
LYWLARTKPYPMVILSGVLLVLSFPPSPLAFLAYVAFIPLLLVMDHTPDRIFEDRLWGFFKAGIINLWRILTLQILWRYRGKNWRYKRRSISRYAQIFRYAYTTFLIWNFGVGYWIILTAFGVESGGEKIAAFTAGMMANLLNPFLMTIPVYLFARLRRASTAFIFSLGFVMFWLSFEYLHFHWELSWSWLTLGHSQSMYPDWVQYLEYTGTLGISLHILLVNVLGYQMVRAAQISQWQRWAFAGGIVLLLALPFALNPYLLNPERQVFQPDGELNVRLIQPNVDPYEKFSGTAKQQIEDFVELISQPGLDSIDLVILPETAIPRTVWRHELRSDPLLAPLWAILLQHPRLSLLTGLTEVRRIDETTEKVPQSARYSPSYGHYEYYNATALLNKDTLPQTFQKGKLVPLVERMPYLETLAFLKDYNIDLGGSFGNYGKPPEIKPLSLHPSGAQVASLVCYESEYGDYIRLLIGEEPGLISIVTNDGWWNFDNSTNQRSGSSGYIQHAHLASLRAIETRREIARSANTGISCFVDNQGKLRQQSDYWVPTYVDGKVKLYGGQTFYVRHGDYIGWGASILSVFLIFFLWWKGRKKK